MNDVDINETVVCNKFIFGKQDFKYFISYEDNKKIRPYLTFFPEESIYKGYFMIKDEENFNKYLTILEKVSNIMINKN